MTYNQQGGFVNSAGFATNQLTLLKSLPAGAVLTHFVCEGITNSQAASGAVATTTFGSDATVGGLQYGNAGYGGQALTGGTTGGQPWVTFGNLCRSSAYWITLPGLAPQNATILINRPVSIDVRCCVRCATAQDFYLAAGSFPGATYSFGLQVSWWMEWAT